MGGGVYGASVGLGADGRKWEGVWVGGGGALTILKSADLKVRPPL